jgi:hypothetical protein
LKPISSRFTISSNHLFSSIFGVFSITSLIKNKEFTGVQEFSAPLSDFPHELAEIVRGCMHPNCERRPTTDDLFTFLENPIQSSYLEEERKRRERDKRGYGVIDVIDNDLTVIVDTLGQTPVSRDDYKLIRLQRLSGSKTYYERLVISVSLSYYSKGIAQFTVMKREWVQFEQDNKFSYPPKRGDWQEVEQTPKVFPRVGDRVVWN